MLKKSLFLLALLTLSNAFAKEDNYLILKRPVKEENHATLYNHIDLKL